MLCWYSNTCWELSDCMYWRMLSGLFLIFCCVLSYLRVPLNHKTRRIAFRVLVLLCMHILFVWWFNTAGCLPVCIASLTEYLLDTRPCWVLAIPSQWLTRSIGICLWYHSGRSGGVLSSLASPPLEWFRRKGTSLIVKPPNKNVLCCSFRSMIKYLRILCEQSLRDKFPLIKIFM